MVRERGNRNNQGNRNNRNNQGHLDNSDNSDYSDFSDNSDFSDPSDYKQRPSLSDSLCRFFEPHVRILFYHYSTKHKHGAAVGSRSIPDSRPLTRGKGNPSVHINLCKEPPIPKKRGSPDCGAKLAIISEIIGIIPNILVFKGLILLNAGE